MILNLLSSAIFGLVVLNTVSARMSPIRKRALATVYSSCVKDKTAALTFDDGPYEYLKKISDELTNAGAKGTFFFNGNNYDCVYSDASVSRIKYAYAAGHQVGSHTWAHADLNTLNSAQINDAMYRMEEAFERIIGVKPAFMRPPYGNYNDNVRNIAASRGQSLALWDQDTGDADGNTTSQSEAVYTNAVNRNVKNMLVLNHETQKNTADTTIPYAINLLQSHGYKLVTLAECVGAQPYSAFGTPQSKNSQWTCSGAPAPGKGCSGSQCKTGTPPWTTTTSPPSSTATPPPTRTNQVIHPNGNTAKCLAAASNANSAAVEIEDCSAGSAAQLWTVQGFNLRIFGDKCLDLTNGDLDNGTKMQIYTCNSGNKNQQWITTNNAIQLSGSGSCLDNTGGSVTNGNIAQVWTCTGGGNQKWQIVEGSTGTTPGDPTPTGRVINPGKSATTCLSASSNVNGAAVVVKPCDKTGSQTWVPNGSTLTIYEDKCLDVTGGSTANGAKMQIWTCSSGNKNQQFSITTDSRIAWTNMHECLDLTNGSLNNGNQVQMWKCADNNPNQAWNLV